MSDRAILLMAYGTPRTPDEVGAYYTHIRGGKAPSAESIERLKQRYELVGGKTPLLEITEAVRTKLEAELCRDGDERVYIGMKHWHPFIADTMKRMRDDGIRSFRAIALAPHYARISIGGYRKAIDEANAASGDWFDVEMAESWHRHPLFVEMMAKRVHEGLSHFGGVNAADVLTVFSAHSLPVRIRTWDDPYERELAESADAVASACGLARWQVAWQSAGETGEAWIGPDILEVLGDVAKAGVKAVLQVPIGFVSDHLEIFFDIDHEAAQLARTLEVEFRRTTLPNSDPDFVRTLAAISREPIHAFAAPIPVG